MSNTLLSYSRVIHNATVLLCNKSTGSHVGAQSIPIQLLSEYAIEW